MCYEILFSVISRFFGQIGDGERSLVHDTNSGCALLSMLFFSTQYFPNLVSKTIEILFLIEIDFALFYFTGHGKSLITVKFTKRSQGPREKDKTNRSETTRLPL